MLRSVRRGASGRRKLAFLAAAACGLGVVLTAVAASPGAYGLNVLRRHGGSYSAAVRANDPRLSVGMRLALHDRPPIATAGSLDWRAIGSGFETAELPVLAEGTEVDRLLLARIDPSRFRFVVRTAPAGDRELDDWMRELGAALVINGSYFSRRGAPVTPLVSAGLALGPRRYDARHGAFIVTPSGVEIRDLAAEDWREALRGAEEAMVSYPLLLAADGSSRVAADRHWLANRSFVAVDDGGKIVLGTTTDAFFSLDRLAAFLRQSPLRLAVALNLDGGPVACQGIALADYRRDFCGRWELVERDGELRLLTWGFGSRRAAMPIVLAALPR